MGFEAPGGSFGEVRADAPSDLGPSDFWTPLAGGFAPFGFSPDVGETTGALDDWAPRGVVGMGEIRVLIEEAFGHGAGPGDEAGVG